MLIYPFAKNQKYSEKFNEIVTDAEEAAGKNECFYVVDGNVN